MTENGECEIESHIMLSLFAMICMKDSRIEAHVSCCNDNSQSGLTSLITVHLEKLTSDTKTLSQHGTTGILKDVITRMQPQFIL